MTTGDGRPVALRLDDVGACSKRYEVYSTWRVEWGPLALDGNWLLLKYLPPFRRWGVYREMTASEWEAVFDLLRAHKACLTVAITASWVEGSGRLTPFPEKYPSQAATLKRGVEEGLIEIANHGLTHCVVEDRQFRARWFAGNRRFHREFLDWVPPQVHEDHIARAQAILQGHFEVPVVTLVPPGNRFTEATLTSAARHGLRYVSCATEPRIAGDLKILGDRDTVPFHDRDLVLNGLPWLQQRLETHTPHGFCRVRDLGAAAVL